MVGATLAAAAVPPTAAAVEVPKAVENPLPEGDPVGNEIAAEDEPDGKLEGAGVAEPLPDAPATPLAPAAAPEDALLLALFYACRFSSPYRVKVQTERT